MRVRISETHLTTVYSTQFFFFFRPKIKQLLYEGTTLVIDRYSFSGVAYSTAKPNLNFEWCCKPEEGLPKPDVVFLLNVSEKVLLSRAGFGDERYEKSEFQQTALKNLLKLKDDTWKVCS